MHINRKLLNRHVGIFLRSASANSVFEEFESPLAIRLIATAVLLVLGIAMMLTIVWIRDGAQAIWAILQGESLRDPRGHLRREPELLHPLIAFGIIIGREGYGLVLGTFDEEVERDPDFLAAKSNELARLYSEGAGNPHEEDVVKLLHDDNYRVNRRRRLIEPQAQGRELYLFDMELKMDEMSSGPEETVVIACVATRGDHGAIQQIPWRIVRDSVTE